MVLTSKEFVQEEKNVPKSMATKRAGQVNKLTCTQHKSIRAGASQFGKSKREPSLWTLTRCEWPAHYHSELVSDAQHKVCAVSCGALGVTVRAEGQQERAACERHSHRVATEPSGTASAACMPLQDAVLERMKRSSLSWRVGAHWGSMKHHFVIPPWIAFDTPRDFPRGSTSSPHHPPAMTTPSARPMTNTIQTLHRTPPNSVVKHVGPPRARSTPSTSAPPHPFALPRLSLPRPIPALPGTTCSTSRMRRAHRGRCSSPAPSSSPPRVALATVLPLHAPHHAALYNATGSTTRVPPPSAAEYLAHCRTRALENHIWPQRRPHHLRQSLSMARAAAVASALAILSPIRCPSATRDGSALTCPRPACTHQEDGAHPSRSLHPRQRSTLPPVVLVADPCAKTAVLAGSVAYAVRQRAYVHPSFLVLFDLLFSFFDAEMLVIQDADQGSRMDRQWGVRERDCLPVFL
ncbi:hypothetical protein FB451DRAFT_1168451 [Mycena latifolia]|nr:hypothetical protein FB451DRAFT_1168451 [Mycena latifolia]